MLGILILLHAEHTVVPSRPSYSIFAKIAQLNPADDMFIVIKESLITRTASGEKQISTK